MASGEVVVADDDASVREAIVRTLVRRGFRVRAFPGAEAALHALESEPADILITDLLLDGRDGLSLLERAKAQTPDVEVVVLTAHGTVESAVSAIKAGAYDFVKKPVRRDVLVNVVSRALERRDLARQVRALEARLASVPPAGAAQQADEIVGRSRAMLEVLDTIELVAPTDATILLTGESGTGKELMARRIHRRSPRVRGPFVAVNCGALPESLLEAELFGHERGAFTGAVGRRIGRFERAHGGTLFLDEVGDITPAVQVKLLRVLEKASFERLGGTETIEADIRLIAATNRDLGAAMKSGDFREDLFYRLNVVEVRLPPLRERPGDINLLAASFLARASRTQQKRVASVARRAQELLERYPWPGNVRELENAIERAVVLCRSEEVEPGDLPPAVRSYTPDVRAVRQAGGFVIPVGTPLDVAERLLIEGTLAHYGGDKRKCARSLGIGVRTIYRKLGRWRAQSGAPPTNGDRPSPASPGREEPQDDVIG